MKCPLQGKRVILESAVCFTCTLCTRAFGRCRRGDEQRGRLRESAAEIEQTSRSLNLQGGKRGWNESTHVYRRGKCRTSTDSNLAGHARFSRVFLRTFCTRRVKRAHARISVLLRVYRKVASVRTLCCRVCGAHCSDFHVTGEPRSREFECPEKNLHVDSANVSNAFLGLY